MIERNTSCSVEEIKKTVEEQGLIVLDEVSSLPIYGEPYVSSELTIALGHAGISHGEYNMRPVEFGPHDFSVVYPNHSIMAIDSSEDYCVTLVIISSWLYEKLRRWLTHGDGMVFLSQPKIHLTDEQFQCIYDITRFLKSMTGMKLDRRDEVIAYAIETMSLLAGEFLQRSVAQGTSQQDKRNSSARTCFNRFYDNLAIHYKESRKVQYYARQLCLSPKYFGSIIKQETGIGAGDWIARYVIIRAKTMLRYRPDLTIQQVSNLLGFPDAASFSRYFRTNAGITPKDYREKKK